MLIEWGRRSRRLQKRSPMLGYVKDLTFHFLSVNFVSDISEFVSLVSPPLNNKGCNRSVSMVRQPVPGYDD